MIVIFDLDYTLLDMKIFKRDLAKALEVSEEDYYDTYADYFYKNKIKYNIFKHLDYLVKKNKVLKTRKKAIKSKIPKTLKNINKALFPDAEKVLKYFKSKKHELVLLTWGDNVWHKLKLKNLKITKYFDKIIIANKKKGDCINFLKKTRDKILIINDNLKESLYLKSKLKNSELFLIKSRYSRNHENLQPEHKLKDCLKII